MTNLAAATIAIDMFARPATRRRPSAGTWAPNGVFVPGAPVDTAIHAVIQAPSQHDLLTLPEGERTEGLVAVWTRASLRTADETGETTADEIVTTAGEVYRVVKVMTRSEAGYTKALARLSHDRGRTV